MAGFFSNEDVLTPEAIARRRTIADALIKQGGDAGPIRHWSQGVNRLLQTAMGSYDGMQADQAEAAARKSADAPFAQMMAAYGMDGSSPAAAASPALGGGNPGPVALPGATGATPQGAGMAANNVAPAKDIYNGLVERGLSPTVAAGFAGNFHGESGFNTTALGDKGTSFGLGQWRGDRLASLRALAAQQGKDPSDIGVQLDHVMAELNGPEKRAMQMASAAKTPEEAAMAIAQHYERPAAWALAQSGPKRAAYARGVFDQFGQPSAAPTQVASLAGGPVSDAGMPPQAGQPSPARAAIASALIQQSAPQQAMPGGAMAYSAAGQPVPTVAQGNALNPNGTPTSNVIGGTPGTGQQAMTSALPPASANAPVQPAPDAGMGAPAQPSPARQAIAQAMLQAPQSGTQPVPGAPGATPGRQAVAQALTQQQVAQAAPQGAQSMSGSRAGLAAAMQVLNNPWASAGQKAVAQAIMTKGLAANEPQWEKLNDGTLYDKRTGRTMSAGGAPAYRVLTDPAERARYGIPSNDPKPYQVDAAGKLMGVGGGTTVNIDQKAEGAFETEAAKAQAKRYNEDIEGGAKANSMMANINNMREISQRVGSQGSTADFKSLIGPYAEAFGMGDKIKGLSDIQAFNSIIQQLAPQMRAVGSGSTSDIEFKGFLSALPKLSSTPAAREAILNTMEAHQRYAMQRAEIASGVLNKEMTRTEGDKALRALPDPMTAFRQFRKQNPALFGASAPAPDAAGAPARATPRFTDEDLQAELRRRGLVQ